MKTMIMMSLVLIGCSQSQNGPTQASHSFKGTTKYLGYFNSSAPDVPCYPNCAESLENKANLIWLYPTADINTQMLNANAKNMDSIITVRDLFFQGSSSTLNSDYKTRFCDFNRSLAITPAAYYIMDEPYWVNQTALNYSSVPTNVLKANIETAIATVHECAPGIPTAIIFSAPELTIVPDFNALVPNGLDWAGMDCYQYAGCSDSQVLGLLAIIETLPVKLILVPDAVEGSTVIDLTDRISLYQNYAANHEVVAIIPFLYQGVYGMVGAEEMPQVETNYTNWYKLFAK